jgi:hypothetical protein
MNGFGILFEFGKFVDSLGSSPFVKKKKSENQSHATLSCASPTQNTLVTSEKGFFVRLKPKSISSNVEQYQ